MEYYKMQDKIGKESYIVGRASKNGVYEKLDVNIKRKSVRKREVNRKFSFWGVTNKNKRGIWN